jgi:hypothetical protein
MSDGSYGKKERDVLGDVASLIHRSSPALIGRLPSPSAYTIRHRTLNPDTPPTGHSIYLEAKCSYLTPAAMTKERERLRRRIYTQSQLHPNS